MPYTKAAWETRLIVLNFLIPKLPVPKEEDPPKGILEVIDVESYRVERRAVQTLRLADRTGEIPPVPITGEKVNRNRRWTADQI